jgi:hypothetical protein
MAKYKLVNTYPVARFYYKGGHSHPIQRTVLITESTYTHIIGYEVRSGKIIREPNAAPVKSYLRRKIARIKNMRASIKRDYLTISHGPMVSTLKRSRLYDYLFTGP